MIQTVVKRDGRIVGFNEQKVMAAIRKAMLHTDKGEDERLLYQITDRIAQRGESQMTVEEIQDAVEMELMKSSRKDVAQKYIAYRHQRSVARKAKTREVFLDIVNIKNNDVTRENANMNADTPAGMMMKFASETTKPFVDDYLLSEESRAGHSICMGDGSVACKAAADYVTGAVDAGGLKEALEHFRLTGESV